MRVRGDADERHARRAGAARVVDGIADVPELRVRASLLDRQQSIGRRLGGGHVIGANHRIERQSRREAPQRDIGFVAQAAGEDRQAVALAQPFEQARLAGTSFRA